MHIVLPELNGEVIFTLPLKHRVNGPLFLKAELLKRDFNFIRWSS